MKITTTTGIGSAQKGRKSIGSGNSEAKTVGGWDAQGVDESQEMIAVAAYYPTNSILSADFAD